MTPSNINNNHHNHDPGQQTQHSPPPLYSDAPEVAQSHYSPEPVSSTGGVSYSPDYDGEKVFVSAGYGGDSHPQSAVVNTDPASSPQAVFGSESSPRSSPTEVNRDPKSFPQALGLAGVGSGDSAHSPRTVEDGAAAAAGNKRPWWRRKKVIAIVAAVALIVLALIIGLAVGLTQRGGGNGDDENSNGGNDDGKSGGRQGSPSGGGNSDVSCDGEVCPSLLSPSVQDQLLNVFARTSNGNVAVLTSDGDEWSSGSWVDLGRYQDSPIITQPTSVEWDLTIDDDDPRVDIFAVSGDDAGTIVTKHKVQEDGQWTEWEPLGTGAGSPIRVGRPAMNRIELFAVNADSGNIIHNYWRPGTQQPEAKARRQEEEEDEVDEDLDEDGEDGGDNGEDTGNAPAPPPASPPSAGSWNTSGNDTWPSVSPSFGPAASAPAVNCTDSSTHLIWYSARNGSVHHAQYTGGSWSTPHTIDGSFVGEPLIVSRDSSRFDFFGVQEDGRVYTFHWSSSGSNGDNYSDLGSLGGTIVGAPSAISLSSTTTDVVALGENGSLMRQHYDGSSWNSGWQDIGTDAMSAPSIVSYEDRVYVLSLTQQGAMQALSVAISDGTPNWNALRKEELGGELDTGYYYIA